MELSLGSRRVGDWTVIEVSGELDLYTAPALQEAITSHIIDGEVNLLAVDLTDVTFMDSSTLGVLVSTLKHARERGGDVALVGATGSPQKVLELTGLAGVFRQVPAADALSGLAI